MSFVDHVLGGTRVLDAHGIVNEDGIDISEAVVLGNGRTVGVARANLDGRSATAAEVTCEDGCLELPLQFYRPGPLRLRTFPEDGHYGETVTWDATVPGGFQYQAAEVARCLEAGVLESTRMPWKDTLAVMDLMDEARARLGVRHPWDAED